MTETGEWLDSAGSSMLAAVARAESDATGVETFKRYLWQAKQAVRLWLSCLTETDGPLYVLCERVEDVTLVYPSKARFMQMKTRDRGSWSASVMCGKPIAALVRSYKSARAAGLHEMASFELWLEGPISDASVTVSFVDAPVKAQPALRKKILAMALRRNGSMTSWGAWLFTQTSRPEHTSMPRSCTNSDRSGSRHREPNSSWFTSASFKPWPPPRRPRPARLR